MSWFLDKQGNLSFFRLAIAVAILGGLFLVGGFVLFDLEQRNAQQPLTIEAPAGVELVAVDESRSEQGMRYMYYTTTLNADEVAAYYDRKLAEFQNTPVEEQLRERCRRTPRTGDLQEYTPGNGSLPFYWQCLFDNTRLYDQSTLIRIYPGQRNDATGENYEGITRIDYEQFWSRP
ncbi:MAG: hypothetical protein MUF38_06990 [Anaerolineae bacterium]|jgi:hypothetical protein|nr:hypothetical protein [Anaerolineae bacterium]